MRIEAGDERNKIKNSGDEEEIFIGVRPLC